MNAQLDDTFADGFTISKIVRFDLAQTDTNARRCGLVTECREPFGKRFAPIGALISAQLYHGRYVA